MKKTLIAAFLVMATLFTGCSQRPAEGPPENAEMQKLIVNACMADRPGLEGWRSVVNFKKTVPDSPESGQVTVYADVFFDNGDGGTRMQFAYIDYFVFYKDENKIWRVKLVKKKG